MAAGDSPTSICNLALLAIGEDPIAQVNPPGTDTRAVRCNTLYDPHRRAVLRGTSWGSAKRQARLAPSLVPPPFFWVSAYPLPQDFLRLVDAPDGGAGAWRGKHKILNLDGVGPCIVTDTADNPLNIEYIFDLQDTTQMDADLVLAIADALAAALVIPFAKELQMKRDINDDREGRLQIARTIQSQENSPPDWDVDVLLRSRR
jgi:hypothetical protein